MLQYRIRPAMDFSAVGFLGCHCIESEDVLT
jgi:hypothetical protein